MSSCTWKTSDSLRRDQFCSLIFTLSNLFFVACAYSHGLDVNWQRCTSQNRNWGVPFVLAALPLLVRTVQSVKRWVDSRLVTHLINVSTLRRVSVVNLQTIATCDIIRVVNMQRGSSITYAISIGDTKVLTTEEASLSGSYLAPFTQHTPQHGSVAASHLTFQR